MQSTRHHHNDLSGKNIITDTGDRLSFFIKMFPIKVAKLLLIYAFITQLKVLIKEDAV